MKKILLFNPPIYFSKGLPYSIDNSVPPLGLLYLASYINKYSKIIKAEIIDIVTEKISLEDIVSIVKRKKPFVVGISSMTPQLQGAVELADFLKHNLGEIKIFLGGPHISADPDFILRQAHLFDYGITGEAEITLLESLEKLIVGEKIPKVQAGKVVMNLDTIPFPDRSLIKRDKYSQRESMMYSRGCPYSCYYCSRPAISKKVRYRSAKNMVDEIKLAYNDCHGNIDFQDDTFNLDKGKIIDFCTRVIKEDLKLNWRCNSRIDLVDEEILGIMKEAGCCLIHFGIEAGNEKIRKEVVKKGSFSNKKIFEIFELCKKYKIKIAAYLMIGHPKETRKDLEDTKELIFKLKPDILGLSIPTPFPGSRLFEIAVKEGIINEKIIDAFTNKELGEGYSGVYPVFIPKGMTKEELYNFMKKINRKFYLNFQTFWIRFKEDITSLERLKKDLLDLLSLITRGVSTRKPYVKKSKKGNDKRSGI
jgi:radical SAM superfamily enzyme YgiQ (UPF0313 family)